MQLSKLDLRTRESALRGGAHGPALVPGSAEQSKLYRAVAHLEAIKMPMQGEKLKPEEIAAVKAWIDGGAQWDVTASATAAAAAPVSSALAALETMDADARAAQLLGIQAAGAGAAAGRRQKPSLTNPIDRFLEKERLTRGLKAAPRADKQTLVRRAYLDLLGLPPTPAQVAEFVADQTPQAWEHLVDRLLASPHYGERYGRHWLDVARYADSGGFEYDVHRAKRVALSRLRHQGVQRRQALQPVPDRADRRRRDGLQDRTRRSSPRGSCARARACCSARRTIRSAASTISTRSSARIGKGMLGLTVNCARCHNHKFDPIAQKDYYAMQAAIFGYVETEVPLAPRAEAEAYLAKNDEIDAKLAKLTSRSRRRSRSRTATRLELEQIRIKFPEHIFQAAVEARERSGRRARSCSPRRCFEAVTSRRRRSTRP